MDVIADELRRQAALWRALAGGERADVSEKETETDHEGGQFDLANAPEAGRFVRDAAEAAREMLRPGKPESAAEPDGETLGPGETEEAAVLFLRAAPVGRTAGTVPGRSAAAAVPAAAAGQDAERLYVWEESPAAEPARALSRLFERDARRYDGGFSLY